MIRITLPLVCSLILINSTSSAADLHRPHPNDAYEPPPPAPVFAPVTSSSAFTWSGGYMGARVGYNVNKEDGAESGTNVQYSITPKGVSAGAYTGYNLMFNNLLYGIELGSDYSFAHDTGLVGATQLDGKMNYEISLVEHAGYSFDHLLIYGLSGGIFGNDRFAYSSTTNLITNQHSFGWVVGGGSDYAFAPHWSARGEYRYAKFGTITDSFNSGAVGVFSLNTSVLRHLTEQKLSVGLTYLFR